MLNHAFMPGGLIPRRAVLLALLALCLAGPAAQAASSTLLNVSYDVAREFYEDINPAFQRLWKQSTGEDVTINQSHGGSSWQAR